MRKLLDTKAGASPTLFAVLTGEDKDVDTPLIAHTPPFPAWKDGLRDFWN